MNFYCRTALLLTIVTAGIGAVVAVPSGMVVGQEPPADPHAVAPFSDGPWFVNVADELGVAGFVGLRTKWADLNGDGWPDIILMGGGTEWERAFLAANKLPDGLPGDPTDRKITKAEWPGDPAAFDLYDFDGDGVLTAAELRIGGQMNLCTILFSVPRTDGKPGRQFVDVTEKTGVRANTQGNLRGRSTAFVVVGDVNNDGHLDLYVATYADLENPDNKTPDLGDRCAIFFNDGRGAFTLYQQPVPSADTANTADAPRGPSAFPSTVCAACFVDFDNDGILDLFTGSWYRQYGKSLDSYPDRLYKGLGDGRLADVTDAAGMMLDASPFDILTDAERESGRISPERAAQIGRKSHRPTYGVAHADWNNNGKQDLFVMAYGRQWNLHWRNDGAGKFAEIGKETHFAGDADESGTYPPRINRQRELPFRSNGNTFDVHFGDYNNDGFLDCIMGEITHWWAMPSSDLTMVLTNRGPNGDFAFDRDPSKLRRVHHTDGWNQGDMSVAWADFDNDGFLDLLVASSDYPDEQILRLYRQIPSTGRFVEVTSIAGLRWQNATQISLADFDRDGDLDILIGNTHTRLTAEQRANLPLATAVYRNDIANRSGNRFVSLILQGAAPAAGGANRNAIGARVKLTLGNGQTIVRDVYGGHGHVGHQHDFRLVIGVGKTETIERMEIHWNGPGKNVSTFSAVPTNAFYRAIENETRLRPDQPTPTRLPDELEPF